MSEPNGGPWEVHSTFITTENKATMIDRITKLSYMKRVDRLLIPLGSVLLCEAKVWKYKCALWQCYDTKIYRTACQWFTWIYPPNYRRVLSLGIISCQKQLLPNAADNSQTCFSTDTIEWMKSTHKETWQSAAVVKCGFSTYTSLLFGRNSVSKSCISRDLSNILFFFSLLCFWRVTLYIALS